MHKSSNEHASTGMPENSNGTAVPPVDHEAAIFRAKPVPVLADTGTAEYDETDDLAAASSESVLMVDERGASAQAEAHEDIDFDALMAEYGLDEAPIEVLDSGDSTDTEGARFTAPLVLDEIVGPISSNIPGFAAVFSKPRQTKKDLASLRANSGRFDREMEAHELLREARERAAWSDVQKGNWIVIENPDDLPDDEFLFGTHYVRRYVSITGAATGVGKSYFAIAEAICMVTGEDFLALETVEG